MLEACLDLNLDTPLEPLHFRHGSEEGLRAIQRQLPRNKGDADREVPQGGRSHPARGIRDFHEKESGNFFMWPARCHN